MKAKNILRAGLLHFPFVHLKPNHEIVLMLAQQASGQ
jgi:hypothetical protein